MTLVFDATCVRYSGSGSSGIGATPVVPATVISGIRKIDIVINRDA